MEYNKIDIAKLLRETEPDEGKWNPKRLSERHRLVMRLELRGLTRTEIAELTGYTPQSITNITTSDNYQQTIRAFRAEIDRKFEEKLTDKLAEDPVREMFKKEAMSSAKRLANLRDKAESENVSMRSAMDILDRGGYKPKEVQEIQGGLELNEKMSSDILAGLDDIKKLNGGGKDDKERPDTEENSD